ncbi:hypothetical protein [Comamonas sp. JC664]|uniref:hypothetical protein n=1 Tax=Comamonas sp. JC664 TaxID=2801917 RepID=UPI00191E7720|nr:hypothetical protein [Comamonas sp. JC664]MBL0697978.1 hypothetical protein [Comamonas sp. JC664]GHG70631.1 hypothetical protein GCM10012319_15770 [Comamonas sp. KCTC 72670]
MAQRLSCLLAALPLIALGGSACGDANTLDALSISQGVYGLTTYAEDVCTGKCDAGPKSMTFSLRALPGETDVGTVTSSREGFYEVALEPGGYRICTTFERCTDFTVEAGQLVRLDYESSVGPGWSLPR